MTAPLIPPLRIALVDPRGNIKQSQESLTLDDLRDLLGLGAGVTTQRRIDVRIFVNQGIADGDGIADTSLVAVERFGLVDGAAKQIIALNTAVVVTPLTFRLLGGRRSWQLNSAVAGRARASMRPWTIGLLPNSVDFRDTFRGVTATPGDAVPPPIATCYMAWLSKDAAGSATSARQTFGWGNWNILAPSAAIPRCGLIGDGLVGFRYGTVNCPDGVVGIPGENGVADIDANSVQPADLVAPGANFWHTAIKIVPPRSPSQVGQWACYHNGTLVRIFDTLTNLPRGENTGAGPVSTPDFTHNECYTFLGDSAASLVHHDARYILTDDLALGATLTF